MPYASACQVAQGVLPRCFSVLYECGCYLLCHKYGISSRHCQAILLIISWSSEVPFLSILILRNRTVDAPFIISFFIRLLCISCFAISLPHFHCTLGLCIKHSSEITCVLFCFSLFILHLVFEVKVQNLVTTLVCASGKVAISLWEHASE